MTIRNGDIVQSTALHTIVAAGSATITNHGTLLGGPNGAYGLLFTNSTFSVMNYGLVASGLQSTNAIFVNQQASGTIMNAVGGTIVASISNGVAIKVQSQSSQSTVITNHGSIGNGLGGYGVYINGAATANVVITNDGTISGATAAVSLNNSTSKLTLNIYPGALFNGGLQMLTTTYHGSTINFYTGSYSLAVRNFLLANHTVNLMNAGSQLNFTGPDAGNGNGTLVVTTPAPAPAASMPGATQASATAVQSALQMATPRNYMPPLQNTIPDTSIANAPASTGGTGNAPPMNLGMRGSYEDAPLPSNTQGFDRYGNLVWARAFGSAHFQPSTDAIAGTINRTTGVLVGYDRQFTNWRLGAYGGYGLSNTVLADSSAKLQTEMYIGGLYGRTKLAGATVTINLAGGLLGNHSSRIINGGRDASASADFSGAFVAPDVAIATDIPLGYGFVLTPGLRARYISTFTQDYAESGSNQNIAYQGAKSHMLEERAELRLARAQRVAGTVLTTHLDGALIASQRLGSGAISANVLGTEFSVQNGTAGTLTGLMLGAGLDMQLSRNTSVYTSGDVTEYTDGSKAASARLGLRMAF